MLKLFNDFYFLDLDEEQKQLDRDWYNLEEAGAVDETHNAFSDLDGYYKKKEEKARREMMVITYSNVRKKLVQELYKRIEIRICGRRIGC